MPNQYPESPVPACFVPERVGEIWRVPYQQLAAEAPAWARAHNIAPAAMDHKKICLVNVDMQNTFCSPGFELYVAGASGTGAVDDTRRLCEFIYRNLGSLTHIVSTMDTHAPITIFHSLFLIDDQGEHPGPYTVVTDEDIESGRWKFNPSVAPSLGITASYGQKELEHYSRQLRVGGKYDLTVWPYHAMQGSIGHALVSSLEEAIFFHSVVRHSQPHFHVKGDEPLTEHYSVLGPEVKLTADGRALSPKSSKFMHLLKSYDAMIIAGEAKSHCVAWTIEDLLNDISIYDPRLSEKVYILEDCTTPIVVPGVIDYTQQADVEFKCFAAAGVHLVKSTDPIAAWLKC